jgi:hypothetical protein
MSAHLHNAAEFYQRFTFAPIEARHIKVGDLVANQGTVTKVAKGPKTEKQVKDEWFRPAAGEVSYRCGPGFASKGAANRIVIIGRREWK